MASTFVRLGPPLAGVPSVFFGVFAMVFESVVRLVRPEPIDFGPALVVAVIGLVVNVACALVLMGAHGHGHDLTWLQRS